MAEKLCREEHWAKASSDYANTGFSCGSAKKADALARGDKATLFDDAIEWFEQAFDGDYGPAIQQVTLSLVAVRTTSDLLQQTMVDLACHPELFQPLREGLAQKS
ncbi:Cytochrome P450 monooxygenase eqxH [Colletotrichum trifolii]|uniref:Cytochrome P450 monooxygenase eqxH n=1 Tax=Colletotrichum trifolii TaxID=5466 RepID=A0A4R8RE21_COLTR|nr:Cytochrome P450 monooxygenase eqxH [Colletotrichum trifolii]